MIDKPQVLLTFQHHSVEHRLVLHYRSHYGHDLHLEKKCKDALGTEMWFPVHSFRNLDNERDESDEQVTLLQLALEIVRLQSVLHVPVFKMNVDDLVHVLRGEISNGNISGDTAAIIAERLDQLYTECV